MTIEVKPEQACILHEAILEGRFQAVDQALDQALSSLSESAVAALEPVRSMSPAERAEAFISWAESHSHANPSLSDEAINRESIYADRG